MLFGRKDSVAFTVGRRGARGTLRREDAERYARRAFEEAGVPPPEAVEIEAFENEAGWLVFASPRKAAEIYIRFENTDDFLDAVSAFGAHGVTMEGWAVGGYTVRLSGERERVAAYAARLCEYGTPIEAPAGYALHLREQEV